MSMSWQNVFLSSYLNSSFYPILDHVFTFQVLWIKRHALTLQAPRLASTKTCPRSFIVLSPQSSL